MSIRKEDFSGNLNIIKFWIIYDQESSLSPVFYIYFVSTSITIFIHINDTCYHNSKLISAPQITTKKMMQFELFLPTWPTSNFPCSTFKNNTTNDPDIDFFGIDDSEFCSSFASPEESSMISSNSHLPAMFSEEFFDLDDIEISSALEVLETLSCGDIEDICDWINANDGEGNSSSPITVEGDEWSPCLSLESNQNPLVLTDMPIDLPGEEMELDNELSLLHLLRAYGEAMENGNKELAKVIVKSINEKSNPLGTTVERVAYNLFESRDNHGEYLRQESSKNFITAFKVFYQSLTCGRFAHFTANSAILESVPDDAATLHVIDFDIGEGIQWPSLIEALSRKQKALRLTSVKLEEECTWDFEETKKRLKDHAKQYGLKVQIEEKSIEDLAGELMRMKKRGQGRDWVVFNCMVGLPHMARRKPRSRVIEFLKVANELLANFAGIVTLGDGEAEEDLGTCCSYSSYFNKLLRHYQALFESLERNFPVYLAEARIAMESLFLAPFMSPIAWSQDWEETTKSHNLETVLEGRKVSQESLAEAKIMVNERQNSYNVKIEGFSEHEMVLQWKETPLVRVSIFCNRQW